MSKKHRTFTYRYNGKQLRDAFDEMMRAAQTGIPSIKADECTVESPSMLSKELASPKTELFLHILKTRPNTLQDLAQGLGKDETEVLKESKSLHAMGLIKLIPILYDKKSYRILSQYDCLRFEFGPFFGEKNPCQAYSINENENENEKYDLVRFATEFKKSLIDKWPSWRPYLEHLNTDDGIFRASIPIKHENHISDLIIETDEFFQITVWYDQSHSHFGHGIVPDDLAYDEAITHIYEIIS